MVEKGVHLVSKYASKLEKVGEINFPFEQMADEFKFYGRDYYAAVALKAVQDWSKEHSIILYLGLDGAVYGFEVVAIGAEDHTTFSTYHIARTALMLNSHHVVQVHNHPQSFKVVSSQQDFTCADVLKETLKPFKITLVDSIVITDNGRYSSSWQQEAEIRRNGAAALKTRSLGDVDAQEQKTAEKKSGVINLKLIKTMYLLLLLIPVGLFGKENFDAFYNNLNTFQGVSSLIIALIYMVVGSLCVLNAMNTLVSWVTSIKSRRGVN